MSQRPKEKRVGLYHHYVFDGYPRLKKLYVRIKLPPPVLREILEEEDDAIELESDIPATIGNKYIVKLKLLPLILRSLAIDLDSSELDSLSDEEIISLDRQLNEVLTENALAKSLVRKLAAGAVLVLSVSSPSGEISSASESQIDPKLPHRKPTLLRSSSQAPDEYRPIPRNIIPILSQELHQFKDEDFAMVNKIVFSLNDPLSATKIKLPVKSVNCIHFECFDFENFCIFNKIPQGIQLFTRKEMIRKNVSKLKVSRTSSNGSHQAVAPKSLKSEYNKLSEDFIKILDNPTPYKTKFIVPKVPTYKCPFCDGEFQLNQLMILDSFNYFVKSTPRDTSRVELLDMNKYKIVDDFKKKTSEEQEEGVIVLSDNDEDPGPAPRKHIATQSSDATLIDTLDEFNDGLDEELLRMSNGFTHGIQGSGSWDDPIEL